jgi:hypothetical protein
MMRDGIAFGVLMTICVFLMVLTAVLGTKFVLPPHP